MSTGGFKRGFKLLNNTGCKCIVSYNLWRLSPLKMHLLPHVSVYLLFSCVVPENVFSVRLSNSSHLLSTTWQHFFRMSGRHFNFLGWKHSRAQCVCVFFRLLLFCFVFVCLQFFIEYQDCFYLYIYLIMVKVLPCRKFKMKLLQVPNIQLDS